LRINFVICNLILKILRFFSTARGFLQASTSVYVCVPQVSLTKLIYVSGPHSACQMKLQENCTNARKRIDREETKMARPIYTILHMDTLRRAYSSERLEQTLTPGRSTLEEKARVSLRCFPWRFLKNSDTEWCHAKPFKQRYCKGEKSDSIVNYKALTRGSTDHISSIFYSMTVNLNLWRWPSTLIEAATRWIKCAKISARGHFAQRLLSGFCLDSHTDTNCSICTTNVNF